MAKNYNEVFGDVDWRETAGIAHLLPGLERYSSDGIEPGGFLKAVLEDKLAESVKRAAPDLKPLVWKVVDFVYRYLPASSYGSPEKVAAWIRQHAESRQADR